MPNIEQKVVPNNFQSHNNLAVTWPKDYPSYPFYDWTIVYVSIITTSTYVFGIRNFAVDSTPRFLAEDFYI